MDAKVTSDFRDRRTWVPYREGDTFHGSPARVAELAELGCVEAPKPKATPRKRATRKTAAKG